MGGHVPAAAQRHPGTKPGSPSRAKPQFTKASLQVLCLLPFPGAGRACSVAKLSLPTGRPAVGGLSPLLLCAAPHLPAIFASVLHVGSIAVRNPQLSQPTVNNKWCCPSSGRGGDRFILLFLRAAEGTHVCRVTVTPGPKGHRRSEVQPVMVGPCLLVGMLPWDSHKSTCSLIPFSHTVVRQLPC